jgi:Domain of unknown function (DUF5615)
MLRLLLDEHISPRVAHGLQRRDASMVVHALAEWEQGNFLGQDDDACLTEAARQRLTLVTYDRRAIPLLLKTWAESGRSHSGVIFVDDRTIGPADVGGLVLALHQLYKFSKKWEWKDRVCLLQR